MLQSLRWRTWLLLMLSTAITLLICGWIYYEAARLTIMNSITDSAGTIARTSAGSVAARTDTLLKQASALSDRISTTARDNGDYVSALQREFWSLGSFNALGYSDLNGTLRMTDDTVSSLKTDPSFAKVVAGQSVLTHAIETPRLSDRQVVNVLVPVYGRYRIVSGVLLASAPITELEGGLAPFQPQRSEDGRGLGEYTIFDGMGYTIFTSGDGTSISPQLRDRLVRSLEKRPSAEAASGGSQYFASKVEGTNWTLVLAVPTGELFKPLGTLKVRTIAICLSAELALALLLLLLISPPFRRIREILRNTEKVAAGNFHVEPLTARVKDEVGALAVSVNRMVEHLRNLFEPLQAVTNQNDYGIIVTDEKYVITQFNETAQRMLGYRADEIEGVATPLLFTDMEELGRDAKRLSGKLGRSVEPGLDYLREMIAGRMSYSEERYYMRKDGRPVPVFLNVSRVVDPLGRTTGYVGLFRDISRHKQIEAELLQAKQTAENANAAKSVFLARMSHEIRTPINGIVGLSQLMLRTELTEAQQDYMQKVVTSSEALLGIVNDILDFSKIEAGRFELERAPFEPDELFRRIGDTVSIFLSKKQLDMIFDVSERIPARLIGDSLRLGQVLLNLTNNAIKFTNKGHVLFRAQPISSGDGVCKIEFSIADTGIGITKEQMAHLFQPFAQADGSTSRKFGGTGLGLVIADELVRMMGGKLEAESVPGVGSRFYFTLSLPVAAPEEPRSAPDQARQAFEEAAAAVSAEPMRVLCIERKGLLRDALRGMLAPLGAQTTFADSWKAALALLEDAAGGERYDYILCDMELPDMYGPETWRDLLIAAGGARTIAMTTPFGQNEWLRMEDDERPDRTLIKPVSRRALVRLFESFRHGEDRGRPARRRAQADRAEDKKRILLVEDHTINQQIASELLQSKGYEIGIASNGVEALEKVRDESWGLVLMDLHMPEMDGLEAARRIREDWNGWQLPIVAMTANVIAEDRQKALLAGMNDVVTKPIQAEVLFAAVERWLRHAGQIDWDDALARVNGKEAILRHMLRSFTMEYNGFMDELRAKLAAGQRSDAGKLLHTLKGVAGNLSALPLFAAAEALERQLAEAGGEQAADAEAELADRLEEALRELANAVEIEENRNFNLYFT